MCALIEASNDFRKFAREKGTQTYVPARVGTGSLVEKVGGNFVGV